MTAPTVRQAKILRTLEMLQVIMAKPKHVHELAGILDINVRNVYHYLRLVDQLGIEVKYIKQRVPGRANAFKKLFYLDQCPCCGKNKS